MIDQISFEDSDVYDIVITLTELKQWALTAYPKILKHCVIALYEPVPNLFSLSLSLHVIAKEWLIHSISPIFKSA